jgi:predicted peroxiredoxin
MHFWMMSGKNENTRFFQTKKEAEEAKKSMSTHSEDYLLHEMVMYSKADAPKISRDWIVKSLDHFSQELNSKGVSILSCTEPAC